MMGCTNHEFNLMKQLMAFTGRLDQFLAWCKRCSITLRGDAQYRTVLYCTVLTVFPEKKA